MHGLLGEVGVTVYRFAFGDIWSRPHSRAATAPSW
jgi:hypothetical protein